MERLDKLLVATGRYTRKEAKELLKKGRVTVEGNTVTDPTEKFPQTALLAVDGTTLESSTPLWIMLHKPQGYVTATHDRFEATVMDLLPPHYQKRGLFPVGRLDKDTEGLLLLSEDGELAHRILSPAHHVEKTYYVEVEGALGEKEVEQVAKGLTLGDGLECLPAKLVCLPEAGTAYITLYQGKFHQIKRMMACLGTPVTYLKRVSMATIPLDKSLSLGEFRPLTTGEISTIHHLLGD